MFVFVCKVYTIYMPFLFVQICVYTLHTVYVYKCPRECLYMYLYMCMQVFMSIMYLYMYLYLYVQQ